MIRAILATALILAFALPAYAQAVRRRPVAPPNPTIIRNPPSLSAPTGPTVPTTSSTEAMYPKPIKRDYNPFVRNPTARNPNLVR